MYFISIKLKLCSSREINIPRIVVVIKFAKIGKTKWGDFSLGRSLLGFPSPPFLFIPPSSSRSQFCALRTTVSSFQIWKYYHMGLKIIGLTTLVRTMKLKYLNIARTVFLFMRVWASRNVFHCGLLWMRGSDSSPGWSRQHFNEGERKATICNWKPQILTRTQIW